MPQRKPSTVGRHRKQPHALAKRVGERIRTLRREQGIDWDAWVEESGLGRGTLSEIERGLLPPGLLALAKIARALDVTIADLVVGNSPRERLFEATQGLPDADVERLLAEAERLAKGRAGGKS